MALNIWKKYFSQQLIFRWLANLSAEGKLKVDLNVAMPYEEDFESVQAIIKKALNGAGIAVAYPKRRVEMKSVFL